MPANYTVPLIYTIRYVKLREVKGSRPARELSVKTECFA